MWNIIIIIIQFIIKVINCILFRVEKNKNLVTYISYRSNKIPINFKLISKELKGKGIEEKFLIAKFENNLYGKLKYLLEILKQIYYVKKSEVIIIDSNNIVISNMKTKNTKIIQLWHACGAIKKFGNDYKRKYKIKNYNYVISASSYNRKNFSSAFGVTENEVKVLGYPCCDYMFQKERMSKYKKEMCEKLGIREKKVILYAPTFRGEAIYDMKDIKIDLQKISKGIGSEYLIIYKGHPLTNKENIENTNVMDLSKENLYKLFSIADILISDFSSIIYEFSILERPIISYVPDLNEYEKERGLYFDYKEFAPGKITYNEDEIISCILKKEFELEKVRRLKQKFFDFKDTNSAKRIAEFILELIYS